MKPIYSLVGRYRPSFWLLLDELVGIPRFESNSAPMLPPGRKTHIHGPTLGPNAAATKSVSSIFTPVCTSSK